VKETMYKYCPHKEGRIRTMHSIQEATIAEDMGRSVPRVYASLDNWQANYQPHMIGVEGKIDNNPIVILIDSISSHIYIDLNMLERFKLNICKHEKSWLVQLATGTKKSNYELVKNFQINMNGVIPKVALSIIPLG